MRYVPALRFATRYVYVLAPFAFAFFRCVGGFEHFVVVAFGVGFVTLRCYVRLLRALVTRLFHTRVRFVYVRLFRVDVTFFVYAFRLFPLLRLRRFRLVVAFRSVVAVAFHAFVVVLSIWFCAFYVVFSVLRLSFLFLLPVCPLGYPFSCFRLPTRLLFRLRGVTFGLREIFVCSVVHRLFVWLICPVVVALLIQFSCVPVYVLSLRVCRARSLLRLRFYYVPHVVVPVPTFV